MLKTLFTTGAACMLSACGGAGIGIVTIPTNDLASAAISPFQSEAAGPAITENDANFASMLNGMRLAVDLGPVRHDERLDRAAQAHAQDMVDQNYFSHTSLDGRTVPERIAAQGYDARGWGENIAGRQQSDREALDAWINSPTHNALLNADSLDDFALGVAGRGSDTRWVLLMASER